jgi:hypothetical protein
MTKRRIPSEAERLEKYFDTLPIPWPTAKEMECLSRPCKWAKILEEKKNNPDVTGEWQVHETGDA